jgi:hypothetical protein
MLNSRFEAMKVCGHSEIPALISPNEGFDSKSRVPHKVFLERGGGTPLIDTIRKYS